jgi:hypothetical protein
MGWNGHVPLFYCDNKHRRVYGIRHLPTGPMINSISRGSEYLYIILCTGTALHALGTSRFTKFSPRLNYRRPTFAIILFISTKPQN